MTPLPRTLERVRTNLPSPATELIGRDDELSVLLDLIATAHLVTLSGPGGVGKTRLALELARRAAEDFDAVWWVALEPILDPNEVMGAVARGMGLPEVAGVEAADRVLDHLRARSVLLVLDALEHVIDVAPLIGKVARAGPEVRVLVTSVLSLRVGGEHMLSLDPLPVPTGSEGDIEALRSVPSVALLAGRATTDGPGTGIDWELTEPVRFDIARLCRQLDGVPLALELAASGLRALDAGALSRQLDEGLDALGGGTDVPARERGLRAILTWAVGRLSESERSLLLGLAVWSAGFTTTLARAAFGDVDDELEALVAAGLVRHTEGGRLEVPPPVRRFAAELTDAEADDAAHAAVTDALIALAEPFEKRWLACWGEGRRVLDPEAGNVFAELDWAELMDYGRHVRLAAATGWWMSQSGAGEFGRDHLEIALARSTNPVMRARCLQALGALGLKDSDPTGALDAADAWHDLDDVAGEFYSASYAAHLYGRAREGEAMIEVVDRCVELPGVDDPDAGWILTVIEAEVVALLGHPEEALEPLLALFADAPEGSTRQFWLAERLAGLELALHRPGDALAHGGIAAGLANTLAAPVDELGQAVTIAAALLQLGRAAEAATAWAVCELGFDEVSWSPDGEVGDLYTAVRASVGDDALATARKEAAQMGMERGLAWVGQTARGED
ncbi:MAG TPA: NB-ARC domain-containing protein [Solirubrobacteraceae bacterium]